MGILFTNTVCWAAFERAGLGKYSPSALSWMFRHSKLLWDALLPTSVSLVLSQMKTLTGVLVADDSDHRRAKRTTRILGAHKIFDKKTGGYFNGQCIVMLLLVTPLVTLPVGFRFYRPDSKLTQWRKEDERLKKLGVKKNQRPREPKRDPDYPTKAELVLEMIREFCKHHPKVKIQAVLADALFGTQSFVDEACELSEQTQTISQLRSNQKIMFRNREKTLDTYFSAQPETSHRIRVRGGQEIEVKMSSARLHVVTHGKKRFVVALKYPGEVSYRYLVATDFRAIAPKL